MMGQLSQQATPDMGGITRRALPPQYGEDLMPNAVTEEHRQSVARWRHTGSAPTKLQPQRAAVRRPQGE